MPFVNCNSHQRRHERFSHRIGRKQCIFITAHKILLILDDIVLDDKHRGGLGFLYKICCRMIPAFLILFIFISPFLFEYILIPISFPVLQEHTSRQRQCHQLRRRRRKPDAVHAQYQRQHKHRDEHKYKRPRKSKHRRNHTV